MIVGFEPYLLQSRTLGCKVVRSSLWQDKKSHISVPQYKENRAQERLSMLPTICPHFVSRRTFCALESSRSPVDFLAVHQAE